ncbi:MAG: isoleucine--tRNA ligase [Ignavibacteriales bacterium]
MKKLNANYNFNESEKEILKYWEDNNSFKKLLEKNAKGPKYRFFDGPITANNSMKVHHMWGRTLKDVFLRYKAMNGYTSHYRNGFDGQGLWVEVEVEKELGFKTKKDIEAFGLDKFTDACVSRVRKFASVITEQSKILGQWMDWDNSYYTLTDENITSIWAFLKKCHEKNMIIETFKPMPWCARCGTSLSEHEMSGSYHDVEHEAVFFKLPLIGKDTDILVWTTTPWTLSSNVALAVNPNFEYVKVKFAKDDKPIIMCLDVLNNRFKKDEKTILETFKGSTLEGLEYETCFPELPEQSKIVHKVVLWDEVSKEDGSGIVHIAPGCGAEDFELGQSLGLDIIVPIDENGIILENFGFLSGKKAKEVNEIVFEELKKQNKLYFTHKITHSYPYCWRCKEDILFRLGREWAIDVDVVREQLIDNANKVKWYPEYQGKRMLDWLQNMSNWNISRRRFYGLPLPFYKCECGHLEVVGNKEELRNLATDKELVDNIKELHRPWIDEIKIKCPVCGKEVSRVEQVGDVWLDAGIVPFSTLKYFENKDYWKEYFPAEYVVEMHEQVRLWFYSMLFMSTVLEGVPPYEAVGTHGMITSEDGTRFSKTGYNISFEEATEKIGVDASRYLFASANPVNDVRFGFGLGEEAKRKLLSFWNMIVFFNTYAEIDKVDLTDYNPSSDDFDITDKWLIKITDNFINTSKKHMDNYSTKDVCALFEKYIDDVSNFYIRTNRRRFWKSEDSVDKKIAYYTLFNAIKVTTQIMAPIIPFMSEYIWQNVIRAFDKNSEESVHLSNYPTSSSYKLEDSILTGIDKCRNIVASVLKIRNEKQIKVRQPLKTLYIKSNTNLDEVKDIILNELNIKELVNIEDMSSLKDEYLSLNFRTAGSILKGNVNLVKDLINNLDEKDMPKYVDQVKNGSSIKVNGYDEELESSLFVIENKPKANIEVTTVDNMEIAVDTFIDESLYKEGLLRDIIRQCQVFRKEAGFDVENRIMLVLNSDNELIKEVIETNKDLIQSEVLATLVDSIDNPKFKGKLEEDNYQIEVAMKKKDL